MWSRSNGLSSLLTGSMPPLTLDHFDLLFPSTNVISKGKTSWSTMTFWRGATLILSVLILIWGLVGMDSKEKAEKHFNTCLLYYRYHDI